MLSLSKHGAGFFNGLLEEEDRQQDPSHGHHDNQQHHTNFSDAVRQALLLGERAGRSLDATPLFYRCWLPLARAAADDQRQRAR